MKVCFYTDRRISGMTGGIGRVTSVLTDHMRGRLGWMVYSIYAFEAPEGCELTPTDGSIRIRLHDRMGLRPSMGRHYRQAATQLIAWGVDVMVVQTSLDVVAKLRKALAGQGGHDVKIVSVLHYTPGTDEFGASASRLWTDLCHRHLSVKELAKGIVGPVYNRLQHRATLRAYRKAYMEGDALVLLSPSYIPLFERLAGIPHANPHRLLALPNCVPFEYQMTEDELGQKEKTTLVVGRMVDFPKRISEILHIWQQVERDAEGAQWHLEVVGDGPDLATFRQLADQLGLRHCTFTGRQAPIDYYRRASVFLMTSQFEGFPMTLVEAQQMGCVPVVYRSFASLSEVVTDGVDGCTVAEGDRQGFVEALLALMADDERRRAMQRAALTSCRRYTQETVMAQWQQLLTRVCAKPQ